MLSVLSSIVLGRCGGCARRLRASPVRLALLGFTISRWRCGSSFFCSGRAVAFSTALVIVVLGLTGWMSVDRLVQGVGAGARSPTVVDGAGRRSARARCASSPSHPAERRSSRFIVAADRVGNAITLEASLSSRTGRAAAHASWGNMIASVETCW